jgi:hypothetical protein
VAVIPATRDAEAEQLKSLGQSKNGCGCSNLLTEDPKQVRALKQGLSFILNLGCTNWRKRCLGVYWGKDSFQRDKVMKRQVTQRMKARVRKEERIVN